MAGLTAAVAAARHGAAVVLMHDRPVLGGNASSEIRMWIRGAAGLNNRETGLLQEIELENIYRNPTMNYSLWDSVLYQFAVQEKNLELLLNCSCLDLEMDGPRIQSVTGWQLNAYTFHTVRAKIFLDCSGDSILAPLSGAAFRVGREGRSIHGESAAPETGDSKTMGNSCLLEARQTDHPCPFIPPPWANVYPDDESMRGKNHDFAGTGVNFWWIELGGLQDTISDSGSIGEELLKIAFGVWDHIKNQGDHGAENWELEWVGFLPGKRESRRYEGDYLLNQRDLEAGRDFPDTVAFGGWTMDNHAPEGFLYPGYSSRHIAPKVPYPIPYRCLYSRNIENLMFAGRNVSATHLAMSSLRVMATCAVMGQAAGTGAALAAQMGLTPRQVGAQAVTRLQELLRLDGCYLPGVIRPFPSKMENAAVSLPEKELSILLNGWERPHGGESNRILLPEGASLSVTLPQPVSGAVLRLALDPDFSRRSISSSPKSQLFAMRTHIFLDEPPLSMPARLLKSCAVDCLTSDGSRKVLSLAENHQALVRLRLPDGTVQVTLSQISSWGGEGAGLFSLNIV